MMTNLIDDLSSVFDERYRVQLELRRLGSGCVSEFVDCVDGHGSFLLAVSAAKVKGFGVLKSKNEIVNHSLSNLGVGLES